MEGECNRHGEEGEDTVSHDESHILMVGCVPILERVGGGCPLGEIEGCLTHSDNVYCVMWMLETKEGVEDHHCDRQEAAVGCGVREKPPEHVGIQGEPLE